MAVARPTLSFFLMVKDSVQIPFNGRKRTELGISAEGGLTNKILGYSDT
jgi:hypothetical protein